MMMSMVGRVVMMGMVVMSMVGRVVMVRLVTSRVVMSMVGRVVMIIEKLFEVRNIPVLM